MCAPFSLLFSSSGFQICLTRRLFLSILMGRNKEILWGAAFCLRNRAWQRKFQEAEYMYANPTKMSTKILCHVDEAHCCDTSRSLRLMIGRHSKVTSSEQGCNPTLVKWLLYRSDVSIQHLTEIASLACTLRYLRNVYWVLNTHSCKMRIAWQSTMHTEVREQTRHHFATMVHYPMELFSDLGDLVDNCN